MWVQLKGLFLLCMWVLQRRHSIDGCVLASTLCKYDLRKCDLIVLSLARVRRVRRESISSELLMCGGGAHSILILSLVTRYLKTINLYIWRMFYVCCSDCVGVCGNVGCVAAVVKDSGFLALECWSMLYISVYLCKGCDGCCVFCLYCDAWSCKCSCMGSMSVASCRCYMFVFCVHPDCSYILQGLDWTECKLFCLDLVWDYLICLGKNFM